MARLNVPYLKNCGSYWRWEPGPTIRARGFKSVTLRKADGSVMNEAEAIEAARKLNDAVARDDADAAGRMRKAPMVAHSMKALFDALRASPKFSGAEDPDARKKRLAPKTRQTYLQHLRILEVWCATAPARDITPAMIEFFHDQLCNERGVPMANAIIRTLSIAFSYGVKKLKWSGLIENPVSSVELPQVDGRVVMWTQDELASFIACAQWLEQDAIGEAVELAALTAQQKGDVFNFPIVGFANGAFAWKRRKTGAICFIPEYRAFTDCLARIRARKQRTWPNVEFAHELIAANGKPFVQDASEFGDLFRAVRAIAAGGLVIEDIARALGGLEPRRRNLPFAPIGTLNTKQFADLRDTAITVMFGHGLTIAEIANCTGHSLTSVQDIVDKHYFVRNEQIAASAAAKLNARKEG